MEEIIEKAFEEHIKIFQNSKNILKDSILIVGDIVIESLNNNKKIILFGNGGSAADAQHIAAEFTGRFLTERKALPAISLSTDTSALTAIGNDYGFEKIFSRQVEAIANKGDVLIGISTSGNSKNVLEAFKAGEKIGTKNIGFSGRDGGAMNDLTQTNIVVPSDITARIQEFHIFLGHLLCQYVDSKIK